jgi:Ca2+-binding EF-hand superfamily protein
LDPEDVISLKKIFSRYDSKNIGFIMWYEVDDVYRDLDVEITEELRKFIKDYLDEKNLRGADFA